ncbi:hypothetical protein GCM10011490_15660 [Pseudoclavibacter endophyticus]|uniref:Choice-of-anchor G family protein n=1 Tax=Pseudoclavibacter endophyticus TaxID=1778590 RepID=A0A6H9WDM5_9MICO|nr:choice-of-anchor G family protein [Pseudoclavibacter endophyticus]KAB1649052.1 choice-of-anchor G family protein [Pseudoclavibacter endophyticus]GGA65873.1 hypothetical protein GCM10011490_15660 [Pseudoclavibacter endophyticus]
MTATRGRERLARGWRSIVTAIAGTAVLAGLAVTPSVTQTLASWTDAEWVSGGLGVLDCADPAAGTFATRGAGTMVSGTALGTDLDAIAEVEDAVVRNPGDLASPDDTTFSPLSVTALQALQLAFGNALQLPLDSSTGVVGQYAQATSTGTMAGASGLISDTGAIVLDEPTDGYPELAELQLSTLLDAPGIGLGSLLGDNVTDVTLSAGAVGARADLDACTAAFEGIAADTLQRTYLASDVDTTIESPAVGTLVSGVARVIDGLEGGVNGLASNQSVLSGITGGVSSLLGGLLGSLRLGTISASVTATIDLSPVRTFVTQPFGDAGGVLTIDPVAGTVRISTAALLDAAYPGQFSNGLNGLPPNTNLLGDPAILTALTAALGGALDDWLANVQALLTSALDAVQVNVTATVAVQLFLVLGWVDVATITANVNASLASLLAGGVTSQVDVRLLGSIQLGLLEPLVAALVNGFGGVVGTVVGAALTPLAGLGSAVAALTQPVIAVVSGVYSALFLGGIVSITMNTQNIPGTGEGPAEWRNLPEGQFDVSAIRIGVLDALGAQAIALHLGRASVGASCLASIAVGGDCPAPSTV